MMHVKSVEAHCPPIGVDVWRQGCCLRHHHGAKYELITNSPCVALNSFANPTPLAHADTSRDVLPRGGTSQYIYFVFILKLRHQISCGGNDGHELEAGVISDE
ncbi:hypothetical protein TNCV_2707531 [Trichonephila clavipes]|nr:hypothetical protein TNCV_2707531 [Trichonephila clavipes]